MNYLELIAAIVGFIAVLLYVKQNIWSWPVSIVMVLLYFVVFYQVHLYADMTAQLVFAGINAYGWWQWLYGGAQNSTLTVTRLNRRLGFRLLAIGSLSTLTVTYLLSHFTDGQLVFWDAGTTVFSFIAQWMLARKILENWLLWCVIDVIYTAMYSYEHLWFTTALYVLLTAMVLWGYFEWRRFLAPGETYKSH